MRHRRTDPSCIRFAGEGAEWTLLGGALVVRSPRRILYDRGRGRWCEACDYDRLRRADEADALGRYFNGGIDAHGIRDLVGD